MDTILEGAQGTLNSVLKLPTLLLLWPAMIILGFCLKKSPFPNKYIPLVVVPLPSVLTCFLLPFAPGEMDPGISHPGAAHVIRCGSIGLMLGFLAWGTHRPFTKLVEKYVPGFDTGDTTILPKPPEPPSP